MNFPFEDLAVHTVLLTSNFPFRKFGLLEYRTFSLFPLIRGALYRIFYPYIIQKKFIYCLVPVTGV